MNNDLIKRLQKASKKKVKLVISDKTKNALKAAHNKRAGDSKKSSSKSKSKSKRPALDIAKLSNGSKCFAAPKKVQKAIEGWRLNLLKVDMR